MIFHDLLLWVSLHCIIIAYWNIIYIQAHIDSSFVTEVEYPVKMSVIIIITITITIIIIIITLHLRNCFVKSSRSNRPCTAVFLRKIKTDFVDSTRTEMTALQEGCSLT